MDGWKDGILYAFGFVLTYSNKERLRNTQTVRYYDKESLFKKKEDLEYYI